jgi:hypothetical protein
LGSLFSKFDNGHELLNGLEIDQETGRSGDNTHLLATSR